MSYLISVLLSVVLISNISNAQKPIDTSEVISIGGIQQFVHLKGKDNSKPLMLFLHGGPGGSLMGKNDQMTGRLQQHFVVVQWDQRETGQTKKLNQSNQPLTLDLFYRDTHDIIDSLLKQFNKQKLYLVGYSWGTALGFHIADKYPELLHAFIAISPVIDQHKSDSISLSVLKSTMGVGARMQLSKVKVPFENADQLYCQRKWMYRHEGQKFVVLSLRKSTVRNWGDTWFDVWSESCRVNLFESVPALRCPVYFFAGGKDLNTNASITRNYFDFVEAPRKSIFIFPDSNHILPETQPAEYQDCIIKVILPETSTTK